MDKATIRFRRRRATKTMVRFQEIEVEGSPILIGPLYVKKWFIGDEAEIELTLAPTGKKLSADEVKAEEQAAAVAEVSRGGDTKAAQKGRKKEE